VTMGGWKGGKGPEKMGKNPLFGKALRGVWGIAGVPIRLWEKGKKD